MYVSMILNSEMAGFRLTEENGDEEDLLCDSLEIIDGSLSGKSTTTTEETKPKKSVGEELGFERVASGHGTLIEGHEEQQIENLNGVKKKAKNRLKTSKKSVNDNCQLPKGHQKTNYSEMHRKKLEQKSHRKSLKVTTNINLESLSSRQKNQTITRQGQMPKHINGLIKEDYLFSENENDLQNGHYVMNSVGKYSTEKLRNVHDERMSDHCAVADDNILENGCQFEWSESTNPLYGPGRQNKPIQSVQENVLPGNNYNYNLYHQENNDLNYGHNTLFKTEGITSKNPASYQKDLYSQVFPCLQSVQEIPISICSAPADVYTCEHDSNFDNLQYKVPEKASSMGVMGGKNLSFSGQSKLDDSMTSTSSNGKSNTTSYSAMYAAKQHISTYQPYTLSDYKRLKHDHSTSPGGLGPDTHSEEYNKKVKKVIRQKEYAAVLRHKHVLPNSHLKKKPSSTIVSTKMRTPQIQEASAMRQKALQYAKAVPKPITTKKQTSEVKAVIDHQEPNTLLEILRQRHEKERKAIDAVRKDLEVKLKTR